MKYIRSFIFDVYFYAIGLFFSIFGLPILLGPQRWSYYVSQIWGYMTLVGARWILGLDCKVEGLENLPEKPYLIASKHQSAWETAAMCYIFPGAVYVLKKELKYVPFFNCHFARQKVIAVDRKLGKRAIEPMVEAAQFHKEAKRNIIIYPEGTRSAVGKAGRYRAGVFALQEGLDIPVVPVALNSGVFWPRRCFVKKPGVVTVSILPAINPGLTREEFMETLERVIETKSNQLLEEINYENMVEKKS
ncbi:lysophospholipid acyltransferase family protein [Candidatus Paracaedibacter symbiosus]|uniref:lysophospholipid acyltransferase family protein n=1 Tax=Candidatus Paracaedibacter symbiosus TaxID=244582 RepID=UPI0005094996|nr:lysophospholipid acyltransferase family protein [Candidatus Paracaedibacter symbiosus]